MKLIYLIPLVALLGCSASLNRPAEGAVKADFLAEQALFIEQNPTARGAALLNANGKGFEFYDNGRAVFVSFGAITDLRKETRVESVNGNRIFLSKTETWTGACIDLYKNPDGSFFVDGNYGNGTPLTETLWLSAVPS